MPRIVKFRHKVEWCLSGAGGEGGGAVGNGESVVSGYRVSVWEDKKLLEIDGGDGCTRMSMFFMPLSCTLKMVNGTNLMFCIFYCNKHI